MEGGVFRGSTVVVSRRWVIIVFRLTFIVAKINGQPESFEDIDSAASNGTVLMAKLVTGLALLHLMQDKRHQVRAVCYLDEASA